MSWGCVLSELWVGTKTSLLLKLCTFAASARRIPHDQDAGRQPRMIDLEVSAKCVGGYVQESLIDAASVTMYSNPIQSAISRNLIGQIFGTELGYIVKCPHNPLRDNDAHFPCLGYQYCFGFLVMINGRGDVCALVVQRSRDGQDCQVTVPNSSTRSNLEWVIDLVGSVALILA